ncbi:g5405 [Coccomyxa viridis]|uniref:G5405 protein n=1 Tax=Coccomyxa viridis TaxID=1274662 RepID=A0ABP1FVI5_9CHLO
MKGDIDWLRKTLAQALGWDEQLTEGVAEAIAAAGSRQEVDELAQDYLGGGDKVQSIIKQFLGEGKGAPASTSKAGAGKASAKGYVELHGGSTRQGTASSRPAGSMTIIHKADKRKGAAPARAAAPEMDRMVANCLCCGKIYDCRESSSNDVKMCVETGGVCTFCGAKVSLSKSGASEVRSSAAERLRERRAGGNAASSSGPQPSSSAESDSTAIAEAKAFKDRLVDFDRNAAKRTNVIDDQSDFFEIDSNAWLSDEERKQLKAQEKAMQEAEEARKRTVRVTIDLLGRQVIMADDKEAGASSQENSQLAASAAAATAAEIPQGGGTSVRAASAAAGLASTDNSFPAVRIQANPFLKTPAPVFMPPAAGSKDANTGSKASAAGKRRSANTGRLQHDDPFSLESS